MIQVIDNVYHLTNGKFSYVFYIKQDKAVHSYFGKAIKLNKENISSSAVTEGLSKDAIVREFELFEYGEFGRGDLRPSSCIIRSNNCVSTDFAFEKHEILPQKPSLGMPSLRDGGETLVCHFTDKVAGAKLRLYYTVFEDGLARHAEIENTSNEQIYIDKAMSACIDYPVGDYETITLDGRWGGECCYHREKVTYGDHSVYSSRGVSSHQHNPSICVLDKNTTENSGDAFGYNLIYSGNFNIDWDYDEKRHLRLNLGINMLNGNYALLPAQTFITPEVACVYSCDGIGGMSRNFHRLYRKNLIDRRFSDKIRPIVINSWESMYFDFDEEKLCDFIRGAKGLGIDTVVLDDGWFGVRNDDAHSLGDWFINLEKLPHALDKVIEETKKCGMKFGIWFEPESVNPQSELYKAHPEWALSTSGREGIQLRNQFVLDFSKKEVVDNIFGQMSAILSKYDISYVKWDMNRSVTDVNDTSKYIGYVKGVYDLYDRLTENFPDVLIEGCSSGGGRFDAGILYYSPLIWSSDDTDAVCRAQIQYGLSLIYPLQTHSNHVSTCPNHQTGRITPFETRGAVAMLGCLGYELDIGKLPECEIDEVKKQTESYRKYADTILTGDLYRLRNPFECNEFCEQVVSGDKQTSVVVYMQILQNVNLIRERVKLCGLDESLDYLIEETGKIVSATELMNMGILPQPKEGDFGSYVIHLKAVK